MEQMTIALYALMILFIVSNGITIAILVHIIRSEWRTTNVELMDVKQHLRNNYEELLIARRSREKKDEMADRFLSLVKEVFEQAKTPTTRKRGR